MTRLHHRQATSQQERQPLRRFATDVQAYHQPQRSSFAFFFVDLSGSIWACLLACGDYMHFIETTESLFCSLTNVFSVFI
jgi:hypothetical protein